MKKPAKEYTQQASAMKDKPSIGMKCRVEHNNPLQLNIVENSIDDFELIHETSKEYIGLDNDGDCLPISKEMFVQWLPLKTEIETAKEKQRDAVSEFVANSAFVSAEQLALELQAAGYLAKIILPLKQIVNWLVMYFTLDTIKQGKKK